ncbi:MAG: hypothetical protein COB85_09590 [Bacteroidetes bacterium]|nr:MAG: hypothetical protein COB85_09590 [Bacteroidota bacterium]
MRNTLIILSVVLIVLTLGSCKKEDEWKLPTDVGFSMDVNRSYSSNGKLVFTSGIITLASFDFEGERAQGDDVYFSKSFPSGLNISFNSKSVISQLDFDIPQGTYTRISIAFSTLDDFDDNNIVVNGNYTNSSGTDYPIKFEFKSGEYFDIVAEDYTGGSEIVLDKDLTESVFIQLDPIHWFQIISTTLLDNADLVNVNGIQTIVISEDVNDNIFDLVVDRLDESMETVFKSY